MKPESVPNIAALQYQDGATVSVVLLKNTGGSITAFAFAEGQELSEHSTPHDAFVFVLEGTMRVSIAGTPHELSAGGYLVLPANVPHALAALKPSKMVLTMLKKPMN